MVHVLLLKSSTIFKKKLSTTLLEQFSNFAGCKDMPEGARKSAYAEKSNKLKHKSMNSSKAKKLECKVQTYLSSASLCGIIIR